MSLPSEANAPQRHEKRGPQAPSRSIRALERGGVSASSLAPAPDDA